MRADTGRLGSGILIKVRVGFDTMKLRALNRVGLSFCARRLIRVQEVHHPKICLDDLCLPSICGKPLRHLALSSRTMFIGPIEKIVGSHTVRLERKIIRKQNASSEQAINSFCGR
jgi:hypothetical protein